MANLYELTGQMLQLQEMMEEPGIDEQTLKDTLEGVQGEYDDKVEAYCRVYKNAEGEKNAIDAEIKRLKTRSDTLKNNLDRLKATLMESMDTAGVKEAGGSVLKAKIQKNGGMLPIILDSAIIPDEYMVNKPVADNDKIRKALDGGEKLDFAHFGDRGRHIKIK